MDQGGINLLFLAKTSQAGDKHVSNVTLCSITHTSLSEWMNQSLTKTHTHTDITTSKTVSASSLLWRLSAQQLCQ